jgi:hypothetical protein
VAPTRVELLELLELGHADMQWLLLELLSSVVPHSKVNWSQTIMDFRTNNRMTTVYTKQVEASNFVSERVAAGVDAYSRS